MQLCGRWTGREVAAFRAALGMKREAFAAHTGVSTEAVRKWERRKESIELTAPYAARMDRKLHQAEEIVVERFWSILQIPATASGDAEPLHGSVLEFDADTDHILVQARTSAGRTVLVSVRRRAFVAGAVGMAAGATVSSEPLAAAFARSDVDHIKFFNDKRLHIIESDNIYGSASTLPEVITAIDRMQALRQAKVVDSRSILRLLAIYAETAAWQYQDQRMFDRAQRWAEKALTWSHQLGDSYCIGLSLVRMSQLAADRGDGAGSGEFAEAAEHSAPASSLFGAAAVAYGAHAQAMEGDSNASARAYDTARTLVDTAGTDPSWGFFLDHAYIDAYEAHSRTALGEYPTAIALFDDATTRMQSGYPRDRGVYLARAAVAYMAAGHIEPAAAMGTHALRIGVATGSGRIMERVTTLAGMMDAASTQPGVDEFIGELEHWKAESCPDRT